MALYQRHPQRQGILREYYTRQTLLIVLIEVKAILIE
jgi:hypothetical protein